MKVGDKVSGFYKGDYGFTGTIESGDAYGYSIKLAFPIVCVGGRVESDGIWVGYRDLAVTRLVVVA